MLMVADTFRSPPVEPTPAQLGDARHLQLTTIAATPEAQALVADLFARVRPVIDADRGNRRGEKSSANLRDDIAALTGGLLRRWSSDDGSGLVFRAASSPSFEASPVGLRMFKALKVAMEEVGLIGLSRAIAYPAEGFEAESQAGFSRMAARIWPAAPLLDLAQIHGIGPNDIKLHFVALPPTKPPKVSHAVMLRRLRVGDAQYRKQPNTLIKIAENDAAAAALRVEVEAHNAMASSVSVTGCAPPRWRRVFIGAWPVYGRWHTIGSDGTYQVLSKEERLAIRIDGEPVTEIDVRASHLSLLYALTRTPLDIDEDPYEIEDVSRDVVKAWIVSAIGKGSPATRWSDRHKALVGQVSAGFVGAAIMEKHPPLCRMAEIVPADLAGRLGCDQARLVSHVLANHEATAMTLAMRDLRETHGILALPVHDSLIIPTHAAGLADVAMKKAFEEVCGVAPGLVPRAAEGSVA